MKNIEKIMLTMLLVLMGSYLFSQQKLNMHIDYNRFKDKDANTYMHIDYQIPYRNLVFLAHKGGYFAEVEVSVTIADQDSVLLTRTVKDNVGVSSKDDTGSNKSYLNRLSFLLEKDDYSFSFLARDVNSKREFTWDFSAGRLAKEALISDIELCSFVRPDSSSYLDKFHRGKTLYQTQPSQILDKAAGDFAFIYFEIYVPQTELGNSQLLILSIEKDEALISDDYIDFTPFSPVEGLTLKIPIADLSSGKYTGNVSLQIGETLVDKSFEFYITEIKEEMLFLLLEPDDDYQILRYFLGSSVPGDWKNLDNNTKRRYVTQMWKSLARSVNLNAKDLIETVRERVEFADRSFGHFKPGRTTDMGRIYIRNGKPDEIEKDTTSDETRYVRKDYQIWKYRGRTNAVYVFIDIQMSGNYQLIYVKNDENESSNPDYLRYLGEDFDTSKLSN